MIADSESGKVKSIGNRSGKICISQEKNSDDQIPKV